MFSAIQADPDYPPFDTQYLCDICGDPIDERPIDGAHKRKYHRACADRMIAYKIKVERRYERLAAAADRAHDKAQADYDHAHSMASVIPFGQPILVGHYSEGRDRRYRDRIHNTYDRAFRGFQHAEQLKRKSEARNRAISSDDPAAVVKLREKLTALEKAHNNILEANKAIRAMNKRHAPLEEVMMEVQRITGYTASWIRIAIAGLYRDYETRGYDTFSTANSSAEMRRTKERIEYLTKQQVKAATLGNTETAYTNNITLTINRDENRVQIALPGKPAPTTISLLKQCGFKWSPTGGVWQRLLNGNAEFYAGYVLEQIGATKLD